MDKMYRPKRDGLKTPTAKPKAKPITTNKPIKNSMISVNVKTGKKETFTSNRPLPAGSNKKVKMIQPPKPMPATKPKIQAMLQKAKKK